MKNYIFARFPVDRRHRSLHFALPSFHCDHSIFIFQLIRLSAYSPFHRSSFHRKIIIVRVVTTITRISLFCSLHFCTSLRLFLVSTSSAIFIFLFHHISLLFISQMDHFSWTNEMRPICLFVFCLPLSFYSIKRFPFDWHKVVDRKKKLDKDKMRSQHRI